MFLAHPSNYPGRCYFPSFKESEFQPTTFKPVGPLAKSCKEFEPWRMSDGKLDMGPWLEAYDVFRGGSAQQIAIVVTQLDENGEFRSPETDPSPAHRLVDACYQGKKTHPEWTALVTGGTGRRAAVSWPQAFAVMQGILLEHRGKDLFSSPKFPCMLWLPQSARTGLETLLELEEDGFDGDRDDYLNRFVHGDMLEFDTNKVIRIYAAGSRRTDGKGRAKKGVAWGAGGSDESGGRKKETSSYEVVIESIEDTELPLDEKGYIDEDQIRSDLFFPWEKSVNFLSDEDMVKHLCTAFEDQPDLILYALEDHYELPESFLRKLKMRKRVAGASLPDSASRSGGDEEEERKPRHSRFRPDAEEENGEPDEGEEGTTEEEPTREAGRGKPVKKKRVNYSGGGSDEEEEEEEEEKAPPHAGHRPGRGDFEENAEGVPEEEEEEEHEEESEEEPEEEHSVGRAAAKRLKGLGNKGHGKNK